MTQHTNHIVCDYCCKALFVIPPSSPSSGSTAPLPPTSTCKYQFSSKDYVSFVKSLLCPDVLSSTVWHEASVDCGLHLNCSKCPLSSLEQCPALWSDVGEVTWQCRTLDTDRGVKKRTWQMRTYKGTVGRLSVN